MVPSEKPTYKYAFYLILAALISYTAFSVFTASRDMYWDFPNYYTSSKLLAEGESVSQFYDNAWFEEKGYTLGFGRVVRFTPFPPSTSVLMLPLSSFEPLTAKRVWISINVILLLFCIRLVRGIFHFDWLLSIFFVLLSGASLALNFRLGQFYLAMLVLLLLAYRAYKNNRWQISAFLLSALTLIKYLPVVFILGFFKRRYIVLFSISFTLLLAVQWLAFGTETIEAYVGILLGHLNGNIEGQGQHVIAFQSFDSFFANIFVYHPVANPEPILDWPMGKLLGKFLTILIIAFFAFRCLKKLHTSGNTVNQDYVHIVVGMATITVLPASAAYHFILLLFPFLLLIKTQVGRCQKNQILLLIALFALVMNSTFVNIPFTSGIRLVDLIFDYPRLWTMTALYIYTLVLLNNVKAEYMTEYSSPLSYKHFIKT